MHIRSIGVWYRTLALGLAVALLIGSVAPASARSQSPVRQSGNLGRAVASYNAMQEYFYQEGEDLYLEEYPHQGGNAYSYVWPFSQAMAGTIDLYGVKSKQFEGDVQDRIQGVEKYWNSTTTPPGYDSYVRPPLGHGGDKFYDDNLWIGLEFVQLYRMNGDQQALSRAKQIFDLNVYGWDDDPTHPCPGGVFWTQAPWSQDRNVVSNGPGAELGFHLYELTADPYYLEWGTKMYEWVYECLLAPNGLFWDNIKLSGDIDKTQWSYNQGSMLGANALLYRITGERRYLSEAQRIADTALDYYKTDGRLYRQDPPFNAIFFKNLLLLDGVSHDPRYRAAMQEYADTVWSRYRDPETGLFRFDGDRPVKLLFHSAMVQIYASLAWDPSQYDKLA